MLHKFILFTILLTLFSGMFACGPAIASHNSATTPTPADYIDSAPSLQTNRSVPVPVRPIEGSWIIGEEPMASLGNTTLGIHLVVITDKHIRVVSSLSSNKALNAPSSNLFGMLDSNNKVYETIQVASLADLDGLQVAVATFGNAEQNRGDLKLAVKPFGDDIQLQATAAQIVPPDSTVHVSEGMQILIAREGYLEQGNYRVSFNGFFPFTDNVVAKQQNSKGMTTEELIAEQKTKAVETPEFDLSKPWPKNPITDKVSEGKPMIGEATIRIENLVTGQVQFLYMVFLADGSTKSTWLE